MPPLTVKTKTLEMGISLVPAAVMEIRYVLNIFKEDELRTEVINIAYQQAKTYVENMIRFPAPDPLIWLAILRLSAYYAYLSYSDRVFNELAGTLTETGEWSPIGQSIWRETRDKLAFLKRAADEALKAIGIDIENAPQNIPVFGTIC